MVMVSHLIRSKHNVQRGDVKDRTIKLISDGTVKGLVCFLNVMNFILSTCVLRLNLDFLKTSLLAVERKRHKS